jgi:hypothetical protein
VRPLIVTLVSVHTIAASVTIRRRSRTDSRIRKGRAMKLLSVIVATSAVAALVGTASARATRPLNAATITLTNEHIEPDQTIPGTFDVTATVSWDRIPSAVQWEPCWVVGSERPQCDLISQKMLTTYTFQVNSLSSGDTVQFFVYACYVSGPSSYACISSNSVSVIVP